jgi:acetyl esterase/lipase
MNFSESDVVFGRALGRTLEATLYFPEIAKNNAIPFAIEIHGGAWSSGHRKSGRHYCRKLAAAGIGVLAIDFRYGPDFKHPAANEDIRAAIAFAKTSLDIEMSSLGLVGSSSGGHLALLSGLRPKGYTGTEVWREGEFANSEVPGEVDFVVALWPVSNPLARYQYVIARALEDPASWVNFQPKRLAEGHRAYFNSEQDMQAASIQQVLAEQSFDALPRIFVVQPELDQNVPIMMSQTLHGALINAGADVTYKLYDGVGHGFAYSAGIQTDECIADVSTFIKTPIIKTSIPVA